jgi:putative addiction module component (TIGR02574 family)
MKSIRLSDVLELPVAERLKLVEAIWDSIAEAPDALELTEAQRVELDRQMNTRKIQTLARLGLK